MIETSGVVEFEGIRFDFVTKGLIGLAVRRRRVLSSRRVLGGAVSQTQVESAKMPDSDFIVGIPGDIVVGGIAWVIASNGGDEKVGW